MKFSPVLLRLIRLYANSNAEREVFFSGFIKNSTYNGFCDHTLFSCDHKIFINHIVLDSETHAQQMDHRPTAHGVNATQSAFIGRVLWGGTLIAILYRTFRKLFRKYKRRGCIDPRLLIIAKGLLMQVMGRYPCMPRPSL